MMIPSLSMLLLTAAGGAAGSALRYAAGYALAALYGTAYPYGTVLVNLIGSFLIGFLSSSFLARDPDPRLSVFLLAGVLGGFTTFSSFMNESLQFLMAGRIAEGMGYLFLMTAGGLLAAGLGYAAGATFRLFI